MWGYIVGKANDAADQARAEARTAGKSQAEQDHAAERAWRDDLMESKRITDANMAPIKRLAGWLDGK